MKTGSYIFVNLVLLVLFASHLNAEIRPQAGLESYFGPNRLFSLTPWIGIRINLTSNSSLLVKYYRHKLKFNYVNDLEETEERSAVLNNFTTAVYAQKWGHDFYAAASFFLGADDYTAIALDTGTKLQLTKKLALDLGVYFLNENSILWYPQEETRRISIFSIKGGIKYSFWDHLEIGPFININQNSEDIMAYSIGFLLQYMPVDPLYVHISFHRYSESAQYRFSGNYVSFGINLYY